MLSLFDVNVLIALFDPAHIHHDRAHGWWKANKEHGWASCPITQNGFVRVVSQPRYPNPISAPEAIRRLRNATLKPGHVFWPDDVSLLDTQRFDSKRILGPNQVRDLYLLALAMRNDGRLATFDQAVSLSAVRGATGKHCVIL